MPDVSKEEMNKRNGETEEEEDKAGNYRGFVSRLCLVFPPFFRSSCSSSFELGKFDSELVLNLAHVDRLVAGILKQRQLR
jgi:hypothetical protein